MKEYCVKRKGKAEWELVLKAQDLKSAATEFIAGNNSIKAADEILVIENIAFGKAERASFPAYEIEMRDGWAEIVKDLQLRGAQTIEEGGRKPAERGYEIDESEASKYITHIRNKSGYRLLRKVISDVSLVLLVIIIGGCFVSVGRVCKALGSNGWAVLEVVKDSLISALVVFVVAKVCLVLIDIADLLIEQNRKT